MNKKFTFLNYQKIISGFLPIFALLFSLFSHGQAYKSQIVSADTGSSTWCPGETRNINVTIKNIGTEAWKDGDGKDFNIGVKWNTNDPSWKDYNIRVDAQNLAVNAEKTYTFTIKASNSNSFATYSDVLAAGTNNLTFDVVYEGKFWFGNNSNGGGPGNNVFKTPSQRIGVSIGNNNLSYSNGISGSANASATENGNATLTAPAGTYFSTVNFASYGTPTGAAPNFAIGTCHQINSQSIVEGRLLGNGTTIIPATNVVFVDPCVGTLKSLALIASYVQPICNGSIVTINGSVPTGVPNVFSYRWESSTTNATTGFAIAAGANNLMDYTSGPITQNTWYRRVVSACGTNNTSSVVLVKVNSVVNTGAIATTGQTICYSGDPGIIGNVSTASGGDGTVKYKWQANNVDITGANGATYDPPAGVTVNTTYQRFATDNSCNSFTISTGSWVVTVRPQFTSGTIANTNQTICTGGTPSTIGSTILSSGGDGVITYSWRSSIDNYVAVIAGATSTTYTPPAGLTATTSYRRYAKDGTCNTSPTVSGNTWTVTVTPANTASVGSSSPTVCIYTVLSPITHTTVGATGIGAAVGLPSGVTASWSNNKITISGVPTALGTFNYTIPLTGGCGTINAIGRISVVGSSSTNTNRYISTVKFFSTINDETVNNSTYSTGGYGDFRGLAAQAKQVQGSVINLNVKIANSSGSNNSLIKAWVDWNKDGVYNDDLSEKIYSIEDGVSSGNVLFGFVIPTSAPSGVYNIRIRASSETFTSCGNTIDGETEDYSFIVVNSCTAKIVGVTFNQNCGPGPAILTATADSSTASYEWYDSEFGSAISGQTSNTFTTSSLAVGTYTYYVSAKNTSCTSPIRTPIKVTVRPSTAIKINSSVTEVCGLDGGTLILTSTGDKEEVTVLTDQFDNNSANSLRFENVIVGNSAAAAIWQLRNTPYVPTSPTYSVLKPALSSGFEGGNFAAIITDVQQNTNILNHFVTINPVVTTDVSDIKMDFDLYYFSEEDDETRNYLKVQYTIDGSTWVDLKTYISDVGEPGKFERQTLSLPTVCNNSSALKLRFSVMAFGASGEWLADIAAIDNVRVYGFKDLPANFTWSGDSGVIYPSLTCSGTLPAGGAPSVCFKLSDSDLKSKSQFTITATAKLANGCNASGNIVINNNTKIWDATATTDWNSLNWQPADSKIPPIANKCVIIKTPLNIGTATNGFAKNVKIETTAGATGKLNIVGSLTVTDQIINTGTDAALIIQSDANLKQITDSPVIANSGSVTAKRNIKFRNNTRQEYNYLISPLVGQSLKTIYPGVPTTATYPYILYHNETNNYFYNSSGAYIPGRGLAVKEPAITHISTAAIDAEFKGPLANGLISYPLAFTNNVSLGYNLVGNPYASNIDLKLLYNLNKDAITSTFSFWDNGANDKYQQLGSGYSGRAYAVYNATNDTGNEAGFLLSIPTVIGAKKPIKIAKVGQGFMVRAQSGGKTLVFKNSIRVTDNTDVKFFSKNADSTVNRYWLQLITPANLVNTIAVVHFEQGSNNFGMDDSELNSASSDMLYSVVEDHQLQIEGKPSFIDTDKVNLGTQHYIAGNYTIALAEKEGIFEEDQPIYLKDKQTGAITNLSAGSYTFEANAGASTGRFEIIYRPEVFLVTDNKVKERIVVYRDQDQFVIKSPKVMSVIQAYDISGKLIMVLRPNDKQEFLDVSNIANGIYILKITTADGEVVNKKISR